MPVIGLVRENGDLQLSEDAMAEAYAFGDIDGYGMGTLMVALKPYLNKWPSASGIASGNYRQNVLERLVDHYVYVPDRMALIRGTLLHGGFETLREPKNYPVSREKRYSMEVPFHEDWVISGQVDWLNTTHNRLKDFKSCKTIPNYLKDYHVKQLAVYTWLLRNNGIQVDDAHIEYHSWNESRVVSTFKSDTGEIVPVINHPLLSDEEYFWDWLEEPYTVLYRGYNECLVPEKAFNPFEKYSPVKWVSNRLPSEQCFIVPDDWHQEDFV